MKNINQILRGQIEIIRPDKDTFSNIKKISEQFCNDLKKKLKEKRIKADVFIGGSLAKDTLVKKDKYDTEEKISSVSQTPKFAKGVYDVDIFVRFDGKYESEEISKLLGKVLGQKAKKIHGSRDYYQLVIDGIMMEVIPVMKIRKPEQAKNITDLSYFHVNYILKKIRKEKRIADEIILAKTFAYAQNCYGAESYIHGFSGYALELLVCHYGSFLRFIKSISKLDTDNLKKAKKSGLKADVRANKADYVSDNKKIVIDDSKFYKNKNEILRELNESKIKSPIILIDPTFKERNALASLSQETFLKFKKSCGDFLRNPSTEFFKKKNVFEELNKKYRDKLKIISIKTNKQAGDIAGSKSKKFFGFFKRKLEREFEIKKAEFDYNEDKNTAYFYFVLDKKKGEIIKGPPVTTVYNLTRFRKSHPGCFIRNHFAYAKIKHDLTFEKFFGMFKRKYKKVIKEMGVKEVGLVK